MLTLTSRACLALGSLGVIVAGTGQVHAAGMHVQVAAGSWTWSIHASCADSSANRKACDEMMMMGLHMYGLKATRLTYSGSDRLSVAGNGQFTEDGSATFTADSAGGVKTRSCDPGMFEGRLFRGSCHVTWSGNGHVAPGGTYEQDFFSDSGVLRFRNKHARYTVSYQAGGDSLIPAVQRTYDSQQYLSLVSDATLVSGIDISLKVTHSLP